MLSDFGADVIKVEAPGMGDPQRLLSSVPPSPAALGNYSWHLANRNKRGMSIDLKSEGGDGDPQASRRMGRRVDHQLPARHPRGPAPGLRGGVGMEPANHLRRHHRVRRCRPGRQAARVRPDRVLVTQRAAGLDPRRRVHRPRRRLGAVGITPPPQRSTRPSRPRCITASGPGEGANVGTSLLATGVWATGTLVSAALAGAKPYELHDRN